ncbi:hypothetical protein LAZ40_11620 [Cereibacter sphaeroides]|uniref:hypothetical protein n=1 Tax=Cereibacter sphaeroides TaxID=1063 RepID=UPI001F29B6E0|nr:hypothetical protein [Cereibacter sphaeroides]MCE6959667.1 hypothetical protein [Cereibacter sphaeroides]MCE6974472.1 hypothetical protein [Cereibacter sphaeroides]
MKINPRSLFAGEAITCLKLTESPSAEPASHQAQAVFITAETVAAARRRDALRPPQPGACADVAYGDILVLKRLDDGRMEGEHVPAGRDGGLALRVDTGRGDDLLLPFTGRHMLLARERLGDLSENGVPMDPDMRRVLDGIKGVFDLVIANPDPGRFNDTLIGQAFQSAMIDGCSASEIEIEPEEFGRKARADLMRARIARLEPRHPEALGSAQDPGRILAAAGILRDAAANGPAWTEDALRRAVGDRFRREVLGALTRTPISRMSVVAVSSEDFDMIRSGRVGPRLRGPWISALSDRILDTNGGRAEAVFLSRQGRDLLVVRDQPGVPAVVWSWPTADRFLEVTVHGEHFVNIAREEIPGDAELRRLALVLEQVEAGLDDEGPFSDVAGARASRSA